MSSPVEPDPARRAEIREFANRAVRPLVSKMDTAQRMDDGLVQTLFAEGLMGIEVPEAYGGYGGDLLSSAVAIEELSRVDPGVAVFVDVQNALVISALLRHGDGDQKRRYLPRLATSTVGAYALSERDSGSDAFALTTEAVPDGTGFRLTGHKHWTTNAAEAGLFVVFAKSGNSSATAFLVDADAPGVRVGERISKLGIRASSTCAVEFDDVLVGKENVLGGANNGRVIAMETLNIGKIGIAAQMIGLAQGALDAAFDYAQQRRQFGEPIISYQGVQFPLARLTAELDAARTYLYHTIAVLDAIPLAKRLTATATAKFLAAEVAERAASQAVETLGGNGYSTEYPAEKLYRDAKIGKIYEGTTNMQLRAIAAARVSGGEHGDGAAPW
ncbi:acyl-CoA dehydrogenase family protein [Amycolatopsis sp. CA-230715]|uniref:acyl-CoA dehydrogenase family protein n=1 Tax=Amycolatopsis sp. CA-230715 TaxID=2745196 RepID=UPI001C33D1C4|nr:acyl-CoA dehydrogenase family protein [Amycolatopsis sp. CA-230715]QWF82463.1 Acyl-CoA dehydrogenase [Amycolatopsis sp. CA-230715]